MNVYGISPEKRGERGKGKRKRLKEAERKLNRALAKRTRHLVSQRKLHRIEEEHLMFLDSDDHTCRYYGGV